MHQFCTNRRLCRRPEIHPEPRTAKPPPGYLESSDYRAITGHDFKSPVAEVFTKSASGVAGTKNSREPLATIKIQKQRAFARKRVKKFELRVLEMFGNRQIKGRRVPWSGGLGAFIPLEERNRGD